MEVLGYTGYQELQVTAYDATLTHAWPKKKTSDQLIAY